MTSKARTKIVAASAAAGQFVALYLRISEDKRGRVEGVRAQDKWGRAYAAHAWPGMPIRVYADNDLTAADENVRRPQFEELRAAIARGEIAHIWTVEQSRLERTEVGWFTLAAELDAAGISELHTNRDGIVRVRDEVAGIKAVLAAGEVRKLKRRVNDRLAEIAAAGRPSGSRMFGYSHGLDAGGGKTLHQIPSEATAVREAAELILAGWSLASIATKFRDAGLHGPHRTKVRVDGEVVLDDAGQPVTRATRIKGETVRAMVTNPSVAGLRVHQGRVVTRGVWEPILDEDTWNAVRDRLAAPRVVTRADGHTYPVSGTARTTGRRYLLTGGIATCGVCRAPLIASMKQLKRQARPDAPYYLCHPSKGGRGCVGVMAEPFERLVIDRLFAELDRPAFLALVGEDLHGARRDQLSKDLRALDVQRNDLAREWARRQVTMAEWTTARQALNEDERRLRTELAGIPSSPARVDVAAIRESWPYATLDERREIIGMFVARVTVNRATPGLRRFDESRVPPLTWIVDGLSG